MNGLKVNNYDCVEDIIEEILSTLCGIDSYVIDELQKDVEYVVGSINIVKLGDSKNTLKHLNLNEKWSEDTDISESYMYGIYYRKDVLDKIVQEKLTRKIYNNEFLKLEN